MIDFHCHLDLYDDPMHIFNEAILRETELLAVTTSPRAYHMAQKHFKKTAKIRIALGFHPELVAARQNEIDIFFKEIRNCQYIGEVGIDGTSRNSHSYEIQKLFFEKCLVESEKNGGKIISIHSRAASKDVIECVEKTIVNNIPILHWFTGTPKEAERAVDIGCWFSINPNMLKTKSGISIIKKLPINRIITETDAPFCRRRKNLPYMPWDETIINPLAELFDCSSEQLHLQLNSNLRQIDNSITAS